VRGEKFGAVVRQLRLGEIVDPMLEYSPIRRMARASASIVLGCKPLSLRCCWSFCSNVDRDDGFLS